MSNKDVIENLEFCLYRGRCTECSLGEEKSMLSCRTLLEDCRTALKNSVEVVRCKDCEYCEVLEMDYGEKQYWCKFWNTPKREYADAFCCHGKPKEKL